MYIIDANNLAGRLGILDENSFDEKLIVLIKERFNKKVALVFDGIDYLGDRREDGDVTIVYTPRDGYYKDADDKIWEIIKYENENNKGEDITLVTDDLELRKRASELRCRIRGAGEMAEWLMKNDDSEEMIVDDGLNDELLRAWKS